MKLFKPFKNKGTGIIIGGNSNTIKNCIVVDAGAEALMLYGDYNLVDNCKVYGLSNDNPTDYYLGVFRNLSTSGNSLQLNLSGWKTGIYVIKILNENTVYGRLIIYK